MACDCIKDTHVVLRRNYRLLVKAASHELADDIVDKRLDWELQRTLNRWLHDPPSEPPYPNGALLLWTAVVP